MADSLWNRPPPCSGGVKRPRSEYYADLPTSGLYSGHEMHSYLAQDEDLCSPRAGKDTKSIGSAYDRYLQNGQLSSATIVGVGLGRPIGDGLADHSLMGHPTSVASDLISGRNNSLPQLPVDTMPRLAPERETAPLPADATNTLYIEGLPPDSMRREVSHIFRPFVGYKEVRLVSKESKLRGGDPLILCFVDFVNPACAATAMSALQGYRMDEHNPDSNYLRLQFSRFPGPRSGHGARSKR
ncbi:RNA-binding protein 2-like isoform X2 [Argentina anserina]|uniref:RNA-binding protein 2-like isoform X2 n=1 Tax=Argentina anserina TaxID=57926 RepID=UPI0021762444|nr:RNA-binding protein 2-like isoform X2 [Potentilla anserina]